MELKFVIFQRSSQHLLIRLLALAFLLFFPTLNSVHFMVQGRQVPKLNDDHTMRRNEEKGVKIFRSLIGSRPPRCEGIKCKNCGHCEAIQVPIVPSKKLFIEAAKRRHFYATPKLVAYSRGDDISNYKPMCWKCKCGDFIFNPW